MTNKPRGRLRNGVWTVYDDRHMASSDSGLCESYKAYCRLAIFMQLGYLPSWAIEKYAAERIYPTKAG